MPDGLIQFHFSLVHLLVQVPRHLVEHAHINLDALPLHLHQYGRQRHFNFIHQIGQFILLDLRFQLETEAGRHIRICSGIRCGVLYGNMVKGFLTGPFANQLSDLLHFHAQQVQGKILQPDLVPAEEVGRDHCVKVHVFGVDTVAGQHHQIEVGVVGALDKIRVFHQGFDPCQYLFQRQLITFAVTYRHIPCLAWLNCKAQAYQIGLHWVQAGGLGVKGKTASGPKSGEHGFQCFAGLYSHIIRFRGANLRLYFRCPGPGVPDWNWQPGDYRVELQFSQQGNNPLAVI